MLIGNFSCSFYANWNILVFPLEWISKTVADNRGNYRARFTLEKKRALPSDQGRNSPAKLLLPKSLQNCAHVNWSISFDSSTLKVCFVDFDLPWSQHIYKKKRKVFLHNLEFYCPCCKSFFQGMKEKSTKKRETFST